MTLLFAHVSWMPEYSGSSDERIFSTHGWVLQNNEAHERANFKSVDGKFYGYVPIRDRKKSNTPGQIQIAKIGGHKNQDCVDGVTVIWFANHPNDSKNAYIVGWYRNAKVFKELQILNGQEYRITCKSEDATLISEAYRKFHIPHVRSEIGQRLGIGYGQSSIWYAENAKKFCNDVNSYISDVDERAVKVSGGNFSTIGNAIDDLDEASIGNEAPERRLSLGSFIPRDDRIRRHVINRSKGKCEYCGELGFEKSDGTRFVEAHHIISLAEQGPDTLDNVIALCPNHHRQAHFGAEREKLEATFIAMLVEIRGK